MGTIISTIGEIENVRWTELKKGDVRKVKRALKINDSDIILELETGEFSVIGHRHTPNGNWAVMGYDLDKFSASVLDGLARIGILNAAQVRQHKKDAKAAAARSDRRFQIKRLKEACSALGIAAPEVAE